MLRKRKFFAGILLVLFCIPMMVTFSFVAKQNIVQWDMEEALEKKNLTKITINAGELHWHKAGKEILYQGHLFDVKDIVQLGDGTLSISGLYDSAEDELRKQAVLHQSKKQPVTTKLINTFCSIIFIEPELTLQFSVNVSGNRSYNFFRVPFWDLIIPPLNSQPPDFS